MQNFTLKEIVNIDIKSELEKIGFDESYIYKAKNKYEYKNFKIFNLSIPQANILKQTAISVGADCAVHREVITSKVKVSDCILGGSKSQILKISQKLSCQPFGLTTLADLLEEQLNIELSPLYLKEKVFDFKKPYIVGILNLTKNSFSDGGDYYDFENACSQLMKLITNGADIIDIGAESTKPFSQPISSKNQLKKLLPLLNFVRDNNLKIPISIDTRNANVAKVCVEAGADIINDVSGLSYDKSMAKTIAELGIPVIIQHSKGTPENMQVNPKYKSLMDEIFLNLKEKIDFALSQGIKKEKIIIDAGLGFGKTKAHNFEIIKRIEELYSLNCPIMLGVSRKALLGLKDESNEMKDIFSLALNAILIEKNINFLRVHNVALHRNLVDMLCN